jgi:hypothetical protein
VRFGVRTILCLNAFADSHAYTNEYPFAQTYQAGSASQVMRLLAITMVLMSTLRK